jgi:hypothetical protein
MGQRCFGGMNTPGYIRSTEIVQEHRASSVEKSGIQINPNPSSAKPALGNGIVMTVAPTWSIDRKVRL